MRAFKLLGSILFLGTVLAGPIGVQAAEDPFAGVAENAAPEATTNDDFFSDNFGFRKELMSQFSSSDLIDFASRQSVGFEILKKFSSDTSTFAAVNFQGRLVRRDGFVGSLNDMEGMNRSGWSFEYHNAYADLYNLFGELGRFNFRIGRFYVPFGLNLQTDTHGSILQLSNEWNFGFERDWYAGFYGHFIGDINYDAYYLVGSGYDLKFAGQGGLGAARLSLANRFSAESGLEGGLSFVSGQRLLGSTVVETTRVGVDDRYRQTIPGGLLTFTSELSAGDDSLSEVLTQLHQIDYLHESRQWGLSAQFRQFYQGVSSDISLLTEATWYFRNDVGNSNLQWIKLNVEWQLERQIGARDVISTLQYYQYW